MNQPTVVEYNQKVPFSIATTLICRDGRYFVPWFAPLTLDPYLIMLSVKQGRTKYRCCDSCMTRPVIYDTTYIYIYIYIYIQRISKWVRNFLPTFHPGIRVLLCLENFYVLAWVTLMEFFLLPWHCSAGWLFSKGWNGFNLSFFH